jgi:hypothetical protein
VVAAEDTQAATVAEREAEPHVSGYMEGNLGKNSLMAAERADERRITWCACGD